ncbi:hypothetical protein CIRG_09415 [Coccidioides immitis RMSCC 2394]|uniref:Uncharacterized protein n=1 Tax=Coccidioides immitis RMSCC 2394 TaxID=404692 RepID=A0A0J7BIK0_COCIT|nr:hypothetical protein CIRG_09415 [Coccidioides immitis RMSCC 2394]
MPCTDQRPGPQPGPHIPCSANPQQPSAKRVLRYISYQGRSRGGNALLVRHIPQKAVEKKEESTLVHCQDEGLIIHHHSRCGSIADSHRDACHCRCPGDPNCSPFRLLRSLHSILINERPRISQAINS